MKKFLLLIIITATCSLVLAQSKTEFKASNGITYHLKDTVKLGRGSDPNGRFNYLVFGGWMVGSSTKIGASYANLGVVIKAIKTVKMKRIEKTYFTVGAGNITNYLLYIEDAIQACEVIPCSNSHLSQPVAPDKFDQLKKLKALFDSGAITQKEYDEQKGKLLN